MDKTGELGSTENLTNEDLLKEQFPFQLQIQIGSHFNVKGIRRVPFQLQKQLPIQLQIKTEPGKEI